MASCWGIWEHRGFLINPDPVTSLAVHSPLEAAVADHLDALAANLSAHIANGELRTLLDDLPVYEMAPLREAQSVVVERAFQLYSYFATAYVHYPHGEPRSYLPPGVAVPLVALSEMVSRPPILAYASYTLANWQRIDPAGDITIENLELLQTFIDVPDATWFTLVHVQIEAQAAPAVRAIPQIAIALRRHDHAALIEALAAIHDALRAMHRTLQRMPEGCHPKVYYNEVRPYFFGFDDVVYRGVPQYAGEPQSFRGETGAQSSIIPALVARLGIQHENTSLTQHLRIMREYMPQAHRRLIARIDETRLRTYIDDHREDAALREAYNATLGALLDFRQLHLRYAASYIFNQDPTSKGTGGTDFMGWLQQLIDETETQYIR